MEKSYLGVELGSTRIKAVLATRNGKVKSVAAYNWENILTDGLWSYPEEQFAKGLQSCLADCLSNYGDSPVIAGMGVSAMMHGYIALDKNGNLLVPFRTWRNTNTGAAAEELTKLFGFNIPLRWSISHLYQSILNDEPHVKDISYVTTLSGYIHYKLTGEKVLGIGDASGMLPIDERTGDFCGEMLEKFDTLIADKNYPWKIRDILPKVLKAGEKAGSITAEGAKYLGISELSVGLPLCPPEGDAETGMMATGSIAKRTGNVSAGTSAFAMIVMDKPLQRLHREIDVVMTPDGKSVAMVHSNTCTSDLDGWARLFCDLANRLGASVDIGTMLRIMLEASGEADADASKIINYNYFAGEPLANVEKGTPLLMRSPSSHFTFANLMKSQLYSAVATLAIGMEILKEEDIHLDLMYGHGGLFKSLTASAMAMGAALDAPIAVRQNAGEGGAWGVALLAAYMDEECSLEEYVDRIFADCEMQTIVPTGEEKELFSAYLKAYKKGLSAERASCKAF